LTEIAIILKRTFGADDIQATGCARRILAAISKIRIGSLFPDIGDDEPECIPDDDKSNPTQTSDVALWMMGHGYVTGHGDTLDDLLGELVHQVHANALLDANNCLLLSSADLTVARESEAQIIEQIIRALIGQPSGNAIETMLTQALKEIAASARFELDHPTEMRDTAFSLIEKKALTALGQELVKPDSGN
jgi:hypothetical protein